MKKNMVLIMLFVLILIPCKLFADELVMGVGLALPPYFIEESNSGFEMDIIKEALKLKGHTVKFKFLPFARIPVDFAAGKVDCVSTINESSGIKANYSDVHVSYQNFAITLKSNNLTINSITDLKDKAVLAFQNAKVYLGKDFADMAEANPKYEEIANQSAQTMRLYANRTQVFVGDGNIFKYYSQNLSKYFSPEIASKIDTKQEVVYHAVFPKTDYKVAFKSEQIMKDFNEGLKNIKASGLYDKLIAVYIK
ncbi:MAG: transporter substrate-binding domain-containing protein [Desulfamplus sp.]|nr:transporter substrate-binding domain-containing protein [Desulfamplus sp.]